ncbi:MAG: lipopolysaccharide heptosyltransferase II [Limisphaerales bacterium]
MKRLLVRGTNWLGDAVMTIPALMRLREKFPEAYIALVSPEKLRELWLHHPAVDEVISTRRREGPLAIAKKIRQANFDAALVLPNSPRSAMEVFLAGIPNRIGYAQPWRNFFLTQILERRASGVKMRKRTASEIKKLARTSPQTGTRNAPFLASAHQARVYLDLASALGANPEPLAAKLVVTPEEIEAAKKTFRFEDMAYKHPFFGINPGAEYGGAKRWPAEKFIATALGVRERVACNWLIFGGPGDKEIAEKIERGIGSAIYNLAGQTSLREMMALMKMCRVFLTNDTGPMHVAAALAVPVVAIFGSTSPELTAPLAANASRVHILASDAACSPCFLRECPIDFRCMKGISVDCVVETIAEAASGERRIERVI